MQLSSQLSEVIDSLERHTKALAAMKAKSLEPTCNTEGDSDLIASLRHDLECYRVQSKQYARTICVLEERLVEVSNEACAAKTEIQRLQNSM